MTNIEMIEFIDEFLRDQEDVLHGIEGRDCTKSRKYLEDIKKQLLLHDVSQQRELLKFFSTQLSESLDIDVGMNYITEEDIEECLKNFNCC
jgi:hypothetical protein